MLDFITSEKKLSWSGSGQVSQILQQRMPNRVHIQMKDNPKKAPDTKEYSAEKETLPWGLPFFEKPEERILHKKGYTFSQTEPRGDCVTLSATLERTCSVSAVHGPLDHVLQSNIPAIRT